MRSLDIIKLNRIRLEKKITITEIAKYLGYSYTNVWVVVNGEKPNKKLLEAAKEYINNKVVKSLSIDRFSLNDKRKEKNITLEGMANDLGVRADGISLMFSGHWLNLPLLLKVNDYINNVDVRFMNLTAKQFNRKSLKKLGFSEWEITQILCKD